MSLELSSKILLILLIQKSGKLYTTKNLSKLDLEPKDQGQDQKTMDLGTKNMPQKIFEQGVDIKNWFD